MKKILFILLLFTGAVEAQQIQYTPMTAAGYRFKGTINDSAFHVPFRDTTLGRYSTRPGAIVCNTSDSLLYRWNGLKWILLGAPTSTCLTGFTGQMVWDSALHFTSTVIDYYINCKHYTAPVTSLTLDPAYPANDRTDVFYADTNGVVFWMKGQANGLKPQVDPASQLEIASVDIGQGDTIPTGFANNYIYRENIEWILSGDAGPPDGDYLTNPYAGLKSTYVSSFTNTQYIQYANTDTLDLNDVNFLTYYIRLNTAFDASTFLSVKFQEGAAKRTNYISILNGTYGFNSSLVNAWQPVIIPMSDFAFSTSTFDGIYFNLSGAGGSFQLDNIRLQGGLTTTTGDVVNSYNNRTGHVKSLRTDNQWAYDSSGLNSDSTYDYHFVNGVLRDSLWKGLKPLKGDTCILISRVGDSLHFTYNPNCGGSGSGSVTTADSILVYSASNVFAFPSVPATYSDYMMYRNNMPLESVTDYTASGNNITILLFDLVAGDRIRYHRTK